MWVVFPVRLKLQFQLVRTTNPTYAVVSAGISGDAIYSGQVQSTPTSTTVYFESSL